MGRASNANAIERRRRKLRGGRSVRQVSRDQFELDRDQDQWLPIRNRMSWARNPEAAPERRRQA